MEIENIYCVQLADGQLTLEYLCTNNGVNLHILNVFSEIALHGVLNYVKHKYYIQTPTELRTFTIALWHLGTDEEKKVAIGSVRTKIIL